jgi:hypothetical protein
VSSAARRRLPLIIPVVKLTFGSLAWVDAGLPLGTMAVNISAIQLRNGNFLGGVFTILSASSRNGKLLGERLRACGRTVETPLQHRQI